MINKLHVAHCHVDTAIRMIAHEMSDVSTHIVVMAAEEMLLSISRKRRVTLPLDMDNFIVDDKKKWFRDLRRASYNWFKHADRDTDGFLRDFNATRLRDANELQTMANMHSLATLEGRGFKNNEGIFLSYMMANYADLFYLDKVFEMLPQLRHVYQSYVPVDRAVFMKSMREVIAAYDQALL